MASLLLALVLRLPLELLPPHLVFLVLRLVHPHRHPPEGLVLVGLAAVGLALVLAVGLVLQLVAVGLVVVLVAWLGVALGMSRTTRRSDHNVDVIYHGR